MSIVVRNGQNGQGTSAETPLISGHPQAFYGASGPVPRAPDLRPPPPYATSNSGADREYVAPHVYYPQQHSSPVPSISITQWLIAGTVLFNLFASIFCYDLPTKISQYNEEATQLRQEQYGMIKQAKHLERERAAFRNESTRLEKERIALDLSTLKMEGERLALESVIRHSEEERSRFEEEKQLMEAERSRLEKQAHTLEYERQSLEKEEVALREERERWERARDEQSIPQGAFWEVVWPAWDCRAYGKREFWGVLRNSPEGRTEMDACMNMPVEIGGVTIRRPSRCQYVEGSPYIHGFWMVDWDQPDCKPWHENFADRVSYDYLTLMPNLADECGFQGLHEPRIRSPPH